MAAPRFPDCTGVLVAGGRATRMGGARKGLLRAGGEPIAGRSLALFRRLFADALVVANDPAPFLPFGAPIVPDLVAGRGAPAGLHAALAAVRTPWVFAAACDMPFLDEAGVALLAGRRGGVDAVLVRSAGGLEPLHAFWSTACLPVLARLLAGGQPSFRDLARAVRTCVVEEAEWRTVDPHLRALENVNTPEDAARLGLTMPGGAEDGDAGRG